MSENTSSDHKRESEMRLTGVLLTVCKWGLVLLAVALVGAIAVPVAVSDDLMRKLLAARLTFMGVCLLIAVFQIVLGVLLALIGVSAGYDMDAGVGNAKLRLVSTSPGILLVVLGNIVLGICLLRGMDVTTVTRLAADATAVGDAAIELRQEVPPLTDCNGKPVKGP